MSLQAAFAAALLDPERDCPDQLRTWNDSDPARRFAVYRNNVLSSLIDALAESFPVVQQLVGEPFFRAMAAVHVRSSPPRSRLLAEYGGGFPDFVEGFEPAAGLPYLADVARLELLRIQAYHAADAEPLANQALSAALARPEQVGALRFVLHPSLAVLESRFAVVSLWAAHQGELQIAAVDPRRGESALVLRRDLEVEVSAIAPAEALFIRALQQDLALAEAAAQAQACAADFDLGRCLARLLGASAITQFSHATEGCHR